MSISIDAQLAVHEALMGRLPVRTVLCADAGEDPAGAAPQKAQARTIKSNGRRPRRPRPAGFTSTIQRAEIGEHLMLAWMCQGEWYSAKHLAALGGMDEKAFYTHVRRMVDRKQLIRTGRRHHFRYRKADGREH